MTGFQIFFITFDCIIEHSTESSVDKQSFPSPNAASASLAADHFSLPESFSVLKIINIPWGPSVRALLAQLAAESNEE